MDLAAVAADPTDTRAIIAGPAIGAAIALIGVYVNQLMQRSTQERTRHRKELRDLAADLLTLSERLWRRGWEMAQATWPYLQAVDLAGQESVAAQELLPERMATMSRENETHEEILSAQRRLMLTSPGLDHVASELIEASRLWPPPARRPDEAIKVRRHRAERVFVEAVRKELGTGEAGRLTKLVEIFRR